MQKGKKNTKSILAWQEIDKSHQFMSGCYYKLAVEIRAGNGYELPLYDSGINGIQPDVSATVNGRSADGEHAGHENHTQQHYNRKQHTDGLFHVDPPQKLTLLQLFGSKIEFDLRIVVRSKYNYERARVLSGIRNFNLIKILTVSLNLESDITFGIDIGTKGSL